MIEITLWILGFCLWLVAHVTAGSFLLPWYRKWWAPDSFDYEWNKGFVIALWPLMVLWFPFKFAIGLAVMTAEEREEAKQKAAKEAAAKSKRTEAEEAESRAEAKAEWESFYNEQKAKESAS